jgi:hypothetical protein
MIKKENEYYVKMGEINEDRYEPDIMEIYGNNIRRSSLKSTIGIQKNTYWITYDWIDDVNKIKFELKSRNLRHNSYDTTMIGNNKVKNALKDTEYEYVYFFGFIDGLYEWKLTRENLEKCKTNTGGVTRSAQECSVSSQEYTPFNNDKEHLLIPVRDLVKISDKPVFIPVKNVVKPVIRRWLGDNLI